VHGWSEANRYILIYKPRANLQDWFYHQISLTLPNRSLRTSKLAYLPNMLLSLSTAFTAAVLVLAGLANGHPGDDYREELMKRSDWLNQVERRDLSHCAEKLKARGIHARAHQRRRELADAQRAKRSLTSSRPFIDRWLIRWYSANSDT
jgi:hypothetical protein